MKNLLLIIALCALSFTTHAKAIKKEFSYKTYDQALAAQDNIEFHMESTKAGLFTSSFVGVVKKFTINAELKNDKFTMGRVEFNIEEMDTDIGARNSKMYDHCFSKEKYPNIVVDFKSAVPVMGETVADAVMTVRGKGKPIKVKLKVEKRENKYHISGNSDVKLSELEIPDPSILIASVRDLVQIKFKVIVEE